MIQSILTGEIAVGTDILIEILKRLPIKALVRSTIVCKFWYSLLTSQIFLSIHPKFNSKNHLQLFKEAINIHAESTYTKFINLNPFTLLKHIEFVCPVGKNHFIVSAIDGLFCLFNFYSLDPITTPLILWNPSIYKAIEVPVPNADVGYTPGGFPKLIFGCGFDSSSEDYKVIRVAYYNGGVGVWKCTNFRVDVYTIRSGVWSYNGMKSTAMKIVTIRWRGVYMNGVIHWICNVNVDHDDHDMNLRSILTFKMRNEKFGEIKLPKELMLVTNQNLRVVTVPRNHKEVLGAIQNTFNAFNLWVMDEYGSHSSWVKLFCIQFGSMIRNDMNVGVLNDNFVLVRTLERGWVSYNHETQEFRMLQTIPENLDYVDGYAESLILLGQRNRVLVCENSQLPNRVDLHRQNPTSHGGRGKRSKRLRPMR